MKAKILTHKGTIPIDEKPGRKKPFRLRVTIGGKRQESYWATREEAEKEWKRIAPLAGHPGAAVTPSVEKSMVNDREAAAYLNLRGRLANAGLTVEEGLKLAITHKDTARVGEAIPAKRLCTEFLASFKTRAKQPDPQYLRETKRHCEAWVNHYGPDRDIREIKRGYEAQFGEWVNGLGHSPDTTLFAFSRVRQMLNWAVKRKGYLPFNPLTNAMRKEGLLPAPRANQGHTLTVPQTRALMALLETHFPALAQNMAMQLFIGFREKQVERLRREYFKAHLKAFDLPAGVIRKARDGSVGDYLDQLPDNLVAWIGFSQAALARKPGRKSEDEKNGKGPWPVIGRKIWRRILGRLGELPEPFRIPEWLPNACRHTAATAAYSHFGIERTCSMLGWVDSKMLKNQYAGKRWPAEEAAAFFGILPGVTEQLVKEHPEMKSRLLSSMFPRGGVKDWKKPLGWKKTPNSRPAGVVAPEAKP